jgi:hypothetical protein
MYYHINLFSLVTILFLWLSNQIVGAAEITPLRLTTTGVPIPVAPIFCFPLFPRWPSYYAFNTVPGEESWFQWITLGFDGRSFMVGGQGVTNEGTNTSNFQRAWQGYRFVRYFTNFNPYGASIAVNYDVQLWGPNLPQTPRTLQGNESVTLLFSFSLDGKIFATGYYDLFLAGEVKANQEERFLQGPTSIAGVAVFNPYGRSFAKGYGDFTVAGKVRSAKEARTLQGPESLGMLIGFNPASRNAVATGYDSLQLAGMVSNNEEQRSLQVQQLSGLTMASHRDKEALTSRFSDLQMAGFRDNGKEQRSLQGRESSGVTRVYHPDRSVFTSGLYDLELKGLVRNDKVRRALQGADNFNWSVVVSPYALPMALVNWEKYLQQW